MRTFPLAALKDLQPVSQKIRVDSDVDSWRTTSGYRDYVRFLNRLTGSVRGVFLPYEPQSLSNVLSLLSLHGIALKYSRLYLKL